MHISTNAEPVERYEFTLAHSTFLAADKKGSYNAYKLDVDQ